MSWKHARVWDDISVLCIPENVLLSHERLTSSCVITKWWDREGGVCLMNQSGDQLGLLVGWLTVAFLGSPMKGCRSLMLIPVLWLPPVGWPTTSTMDLASPMCRTWKGGCKWKGFSEEIITKITQSSFCVSLNVTKSVAVGVSFVVVSVFSLAKLCMV